MGVAPCTRGHSARPHCRLPRFSLRVARLWPRRRRDPCRQPRLQPRSQRESGSRTVQAHRLLCFGRALPGGPRQCSRLRQRFLHPQFLLQLCLWQTSPVRAGRQPARQPAPCRQRETPPQTGSGKKNGCTHASGGCKAGSMRKGASKLDIPPLSNSVLISTDPKTSILLSNKIKQLIHIKSKQKL
jgi:hypothetical protein